MNTICFISAQLDEARLSAAQFRVYGHVARRSASGLGCFESVPNMAAVCRLDADTVRRALHALTVGRLLHAVPRPGQTTLYQPALPAFWERRPAPGERTPPHRPGNPHPHSQTAGGDPSPSAPGEPLPIGGRLR